MFSNPITTGLVILGASEFDHIADQDRQVFANAAKDAERFFCDVDSGLGIPRRNVLNLFNSPKSAPNLKSDVLDFVQEGDREGGRPTFKDLFVYIVTHGVPGDGHPLWLMVRSTREHQDGSDDPFEFIEFRSLFNGIMATAHCRVYFIVDACFSGSIAQEMNDDEDFSEEDVYSNVERDKIPETGAVLFISNNRDASGRVQADDASGLRRPIFSEVLFQILEEGRKGLFPYGFSFQMLKFLCIERLEALRETGIAPLSTSFDVLDYRQSDGPGLSNAAVLPNNDPTRASRNAVAREIRKAYRESFGARNDLKHAETGIAQRDVQILALKEKVTGLEQKVSELDTKLTTRSAELHHQEGRSQALSKSNRFLVIVALLLALPTVCFAIWVLDPEGFAGIWSAVFG